MKRSISRINWFAGYPIYKSSRKISDKPHNCTNQTLNSTIKSESKPWISSERSWPIMRKRERENPCAICGHYHKYEEGEVCGVCGHRMVAGSDKSAASAVQLSAFPSEILPEFLYLGSYDNAARAELLKSQGISRVLNVKFIPFLNCVWFIYFL